MSILEILFFNSFFIIGLYRATEPNHILEKPHDFLEDNLPDWIYMPFIGCIYCMASVWGTLFYIFILWFDFYRGFQDFDWYKLLYLPFYVLALSGLNFVLYEILLNTKNK